MLTSLGVPSLTAAGTAVTAGRWSQHSPRWSVQAPNVSSAAAACSARPGWKNKDVINTQSKTQSCLNEPERCLIFQKDETNTVQHAKKLHSDFYVLENGILQFTQLPEMEMNPSEVPNFSYRSRKLCRDQAVSVAACVKVNELSLSTPAQPATCPPSQKSLGRRVSVCNEPPFSSFWAAEMTRSDTHLPFLFIHHMKLLLTEPGLHLSCVEEVLLSLVHGIQDQLPPLRFHPEKAPQLCQLIVACPNVVCLWAADRCNDSCSLQDIFNLAFVALQLPLKRLQRNIKEKL